MCYWKVVCSTNFVARFSRRREPADFMAIIVFPEKPVLCVVFWAWNINFFVLQGLLARNLAPAAHLFVVQFYFLCFWNLQTIFCWVQFSVLWNMHLGLNNVHVFGPTPDFRVKIKWDQGSAQRHIHFSAPNAYFTKRKVAINRELFANFKNIKSKTVL